MRSLPLLCLFVAGNIAAAGPSPSGPISPERLAKDAVSLTGRSAGVILHVGAGSAALPGLTAELAAQSEMVVHGIALDPASRGKALAAVVAKKTLGQAMIETGAVHPLPYASNIGTLVVVDDPAAVEKAGVTQEDLLRVVSPGGVLAVLKNGQWSKTVKPVPTGFDSWSHPAHDAGTTRASADKELRFPTGLVWQDGVPMNPVMWAAVRTILVDSGRMFSIGTTELENLGPINGVAPKSDEYLTARDVFNGSVLWKQNLETQNDGKALTSVNWAPAVASAGRVYAFKKDRLVALEGATGKQITEYQVQHPTQKLLLLDGVLVSAGWAEKALSTEPEFNSANGLWAPWTPKNAEGMVEAFDAASGKRLWSASGAAGAMLAADGQVYVLLRDGNPVTKEFLAGLDLKTGKELWRIEGETLSTKPWMNLNVAGNGILGVIRLRDQKLSVLDGKTGKALWETAGKVKTATPLWDGFLWNGNEKLDPLTGQTKGNFGSGLSDGMCTPSTLIGKYVLSGRGGKYTEIGGQSGNVGPNRASCVAGFTPGDGMLVTAQNNCQCTPGQIPGVTGYAYSPMPSPEAMKAPRLVEKGPAFGQVKIGASAKNEWPMFRGDASRSAAFGATVPAKLKPAWSVAVVAPRTGPLAPIWNARLQDCITGPVSAGGKVFVCGRETGQVIALDAATGAEKWRFQTGGRVDTAPTIAGDLCAVGSHDGYLYALRASDGKLAWRVRIAPEERRIVSFGSVESVWPVIGSPVVAENKVYVSAGRSAAVEGIVVAAVDAATGVTQWVSQVPATAGRQNDMLTMQDGKLGLHEMTIDPATGNVTVTEVPRGKNDSLEGWIDGSWTRMSGRRSGKHRVNDLQADTLAWSGDSIYGFAAQGKSLFGIQRDKTLLPEGAKLLPKEAYIFQATKGTSVCESLAVAGDKLVLALRKPGQAAPCTGALEIVDVTAGSSVSSLDLPAAPTFEGVALTDKAVFVATEDGKVSGFQAE